MFQKSDNIYMFCSGNKNPYPNQINYFKRDLKSDVFPKKLNLDCILPVKIDFLPKTKMVRMVHMNTLGRMDLGKSKIKHRFWKNTDSHQSSRALGFPEIFREIPNTSNLTSTVPSGYLDNPIQSVSSS